MKAKIEMGEETMAPKIRNVTRLTVQLSFRSVPSSLHAFQSYPLEAVLQTVQWGSLLHLWNN